jgi:hypothetical protein
MPRDTTINDSGCFVESKDNFYRIECMLFNVLGNGYTGGVSAGNGGTFTGARLRQGALLEWRAFHYKKQVHCV